jgi:hypothetical protein
VVALDDVFVVPVPTTLKVIGFFLPASNSAIASDARSDAAHQLHAVTGGWNAVAVGANGRPGPALKASTSRTPSILVGKLRQAGPRLPRHRHRPVSGRTKLVRRTWRVRASCTCGVSGLRSFSRKFERVHLSPRAGRGQREAAPHEYFSRTALRRAGRGSRRPSSQCPLFSDGSVRYPSTRANAAKLCATAA